VLGFGSRLSGFFSGGGGGSTPSPTKLYGSFYDTTTQSVAINGVKAIELNTTDTPNTYGVVIVNDGSGRPNRIKVTQTGTYNIQFSAQLRRLSGGNTKQVIIWLRDIAGNIPDTATHVAMQSNAVYLVAAWNFFVKLNANQYVQLMWTQDDAIDIAYDPENLIIPYPATPSVILTITQV